MTKHGTTKSRKAIRFASDRIHIWAYISLQGCHKIQRCHSNSQDSIRNNCNMAKADIDGLNQSMHTPKSKHNEPLSLCNTTFHGSVPTGVAIRYPTYQSTKAGNKLPKIIAGNKCLSNRKRCGSGNRIQCSIYRPTKAWWKKETWISTAKLPERESQDSRSARKDIKTKHWTLKTTASKIPNTEVWSCDFYLESPWPGTEVHCINERNAVCGGHGKWTKRMDRDGGNMFQMAETLSVESRTCTKNQLQHALRSQELYPAFIRLKKRCNLRPPRYP